MSWTLAVHPRPPYALLVAASLGITTISLLLAVLLHELGHAVAGLAVGLRVSSIQLGTGRPLWARSVVGVRVELRLPTLGGPLGLTRVSLVRPARARLQLGAFLSGGVAVNLALAALAWRIMPPLHPSHPGLPLLLYALSAMAVAGFGLVNAAMAALSLVPLRVARTGFRTDGLQLLRLPFLTRDEVQESLLGGLYAAQSDLRRQGRGAEADALLARAEAEAPDSVAAGYLRAARLQTIGRLEEAAALLQGLRGRHAPKPFRAAILADLAHVNLRLERPELLAEAVEASRQALELDGANPLIRIVRGAALLRTGPDPTALALLREPLPASLGGAARAVYLRLRARTEEELGNAAEAARARAEANALVPVPA